MPNLDTIVVSAAVGAVVALLLELVRSWIGGAYWLTQEQWRLKRDIYDTTLLHSLTRLRYHFEALASDAERRGGLPELPKKKHEEAAAAAAALDEAQAVAALWLAPEALTAMDQLHDELDELLRRIDAARKMAHADTASDPDVAAVSQELRAAWKEAAQNVRWIERVLVASARNDLRLRPSVIYRATLRWAFGRARKQHRRQRAMVRRADASRNSDRQDLPRAIPSSP